MNCSNRKFNKTYYHECKNVIIENELHINRNVKFIIKMNSMQLPLNRVISYNERSNMQLFSTHLIRLFQGKLAWLEYVVI